MSDDTELDAIVEPPPLAGETPAASAAAPPPVPRLDLAALDEISRADPALFEDRRADPPFARQVMTTPLHFYVASESLTNLWRNWNGYTVADQLTSLDALAWLRRLVTGNLVSLSVDEVTPVVFCEDRGLVVGDGLLFRLGASEFRLVTEERHLAWFMDSAIGHNVRIEDVSATLAACRSM